MLANVASLLPSLGALAAVLALVVLAGRTARLIGLVRPGFARRLGSASGPRLEMQDSLALDRARRLHVVRCDDRDVIILTGGTADLVIGWLPHPKDPE